MGDFDEGGMVINLLLENSKGSGTVETISDEAEAQFLKFLETPNDK